VTRRQTATIVFIVFGVILVAAAVTLNISWIIVNAPRVLPLVLGILTFALIIAGIIVYTVFLVREIRRNEQQDSFLNAVTHELKTPIASIRLYLETLQARDLTDTQRAEFYRIMMTDTERLQRTVEQVLRAGAAGHRGVLVHPSAVDVVALARECLETARLRHPLPEDAFRFVSAGPGGSVFVLGDADELRTAMLNLLDNAVKYSPDGADVTLEVQAPSPDTVWIRVRDRGVGIPRSQLKRIFNRFHRFQARGFKVKGTGLGLYIVRSIARQHGGRVFAQSEGERRGATFTLELPRLRQPDLTSEEVPA
jgi:two-component system, OmpR family, sensor histidine kinase SenX3